MNVTTPVGNVTGDVLEYAHRFIITLGNAAVDVLVFADPADKL
jgi:hypothetical protein